MLIWMGHADTNVKRFYITCISVDLWQMYIIFINICPPIAHPTGRPDHIILNTHHIFYADNKCSKYIFVYKGLLAVQSLDISIFHGDEKNRGITFLPYAKLTN